MSDLWFDFRSALRQLAQRPALNLLVVGILAAGIGANTAMFTLADAALFRGLAVREPATLLRVFVQNDRGADDFSNASLPQVGDLAQFKSFAGFGGYTDWVALFAGPAGVPPERFTGGLATGGLFAALGIDAVQGRVIGPQDDVAVGGHPVVLLSHHYWRTRLGGARDAVGSTLQINRAPFTVIGVLPAGFGGLNAETHVDLWLPMSMAPHAMGEGSFFSAAAMQSRGMSWLDLAVRLAPGVTLAGAQAELDAWATHEAAERAKQTETEGNGPWMKLVPAAQAAVDPYGTEGTRRNAWLLSGVVALLLLLACANVGGLLAVRGEERAHELAVRIGLGASRARVVRQLLVECGVLALLAALAGLVLARLLLVWIGVLAPSGVILPLDPAVAALEPRSLGAALAAAAFSVLLAGLMPAWRAARVDVAPTLKAAAGSVTAQRASLRARGALVAVQVGLSVVLLVGAGLLLRAFLATAAVAPGFDPRGGAVVTVNLARHGVKRDQQPAAFERIRARVAALPGVTAAAWANAVPVSSSGMRTSVDVDAPGAPQGAASQVSFLAVSPEYRAALGLRLVAGRDLTAADALNRTPAMLVNERMAQLFWPGQDPLGQRIKNIAEDRGGGIVVGVVSDHRQLGLRQEPYPALFVGLTEMLSGQLQLLLRTRGDAAALLPSVQRAINELEPELPVLRPQTLADRVAASYSEAELFALLTTGFALLALALMGIGLYGVLAHSLRARTREIGIRMALGATRRRIVGLVASQTGVLVLGGLAGGLLGGLAMARVLEGLLFGVAARDPLTFALVAAAVAVVAAAASWLPARRATAVDPAAALRGE